MAKKIIIEIPINIDWSALEAAVQEDAEIFAELSKLEASGSRDPRPYAIASKLSPAEVEETLSDFECIEEATKPMRAFIKEYRAEVEQFVDAIVADHPYIDREKQIKVFWNCPFLPKEEMEYKK